ncbi:MAG: tRNA lysidine(34) synthetase TilS [Bacillota bacterium]
MSEPGFVEKVKSTMKRYGMVSPGDVVLVGVSGGPDSVALLHALWLLSEELCISLCVGHLNHELRGLDADEDARYVREFAKQLGLPVTVESKDVAGFASRSRMSIELAARLVRYDFYCRAAGAMAATKVALGHHVGDQAETVLLRLIRGAGTAGLAGIPPVRPISSGGGLVVIRPLINLTRQEISSYCEENDLHPRMDASNLTCAYPRNKLRNELIPLLERDYNPGIVRTLARTAELLREDDAFISSEVQRRVNHIVRTRSCDRVVLDVDAILAEHVAIRRRVIRWAVGLLACGSEDLEFQHVEEVLDLARRGSPGKSVDLPCGIRARRDYGELAIELRSPGDVAPAVPFEYKLSVPGITRLPEAGVVIEAEVFEAGDWPDLLTAVRRAGKGEAYLDFDVVGRDIVARSRREGDRISPLGMNGSKKIKDLFIDEKVPGNMRDRIPVIVAGGKILWVVGVRMSGLARVTPGTCRVLRLAARPLEVGCDRGDPVL